MSIPPFAFCTIQGVGKVPLSDLPDITNGIIKNIINEFFQSEWLTINFEFFTGKNDSFYLGITDFCYILMNKNLFLFDLIFLFERIKGSTGHMKISIVLMQKFRDRPQVNW